MTAIHTSLSAPPPARHSCPVCGYAELDEPPTEPNGEPSYTLCPSCGTHFGADDQKKTYAELRADWLASGAVWWSEVKPPPSGWDASAQLASAGLDEKRQGG